MQKFIYILGVIFIGASPLWMAIFGLLFLASLFGISFVETGLYYQKIAYGVLTFLFLCIFVGEYDRRPEPAGSVSAPVPAPRKKPL